MRRMKKQPALGRPRPGLCLRTGIKAGKPLGDCCHDFIHMTGLDRLTKFFTHLTGKDCGCRTRQQTLNNLVPDIGTVPKYLVGSGPDSNSSTA